MEGILCALILVVSSLTANGAVQIELQEEPSRSILCPYTSHTMSCWHTSTGNPPEWNITVNNSVVIARTIDFRGSPLDHHRICNDTNVVEVLVIDQLLPKFQGYQYRCFYELIGGVVKASNQITLLMEDVPPVSNLVLKELPSENILHVEWNHLDPCNQTVHFEVTAVSGNGNVQNRMENKLTTLNAQGATSHATQFRWTANDTGNQTKVTVKAVANDGRKSNCSTSTHVHQTGSQGAERQSICPGEELACWLFITNGVVITVSVLSVILIALVAVLVVTHRKRKDHDAEKSHNQQQATNQHLAREDSQAEAGVSPQTVVSPVKRKADHDAEKSHNQQKATNQHLAREDSKITQVEAGVSPQTAVSPVYVMPDKSVDHNTGHTYG